MSRGVRLQKVLAQAGVASRRAAEELIASGRVSVDGAVVTAQGTRIDPDLAVVRVDDQRIPTAQDKEYLALNKPAGVVATMFDPQGRPCVGDLVAARPQRLFHVGRLDVETEGLLLLTNDGPLAHRLAHPSFAVPKTYLAQVSGSVAKPVLTRLREGVQLEDGVAVVEQVRVVDRSRGRTQLELTLHSGRNRVVRRLLAEVGHPVHRLVRLQFGPVHLAGQSPGSVRVLSLAEIGDLMDYLDLPIKR